MIFQNAKVEKKLQIYGKLFLINYQLTIFF
jgi:hypothetical protein